MRNTSCFQFINAVNQNEANLVKEDAGIFPIFSSVILDHDVEELNVSGLVCLLAEVLMDNRVR